MSSAELIHLFPSATHPALPVSATILSTLRALTAPGKGNDLRPEERTALVGVAALLGCERVQSHDLAPAAVQRASSVAPAHFKSALATARALLAANDSLRSASHSSHSHHSTPSRSSQSTPLHHTSSPHAHSTPSAQRVSTMPAGSGSRIDPLSPFMTPRKKFRATSTHDLSGLLTPHKHSPAASSPLRASSSAETTPHKHVLRGTGGEAEAEAEGESDREATPKRARADRVIGDPQTPSRRSARAAAKMRERHGAAAFLAMRPGLDVVEEGLEVDAARDLEAEIDGVLGRRARVAEIDGVLGWKLRPRHDWTFRETVWAPDREGMRRVLASVDLEGKGKAPADFVAEITSILVT
ncbi:hypothetical protein CspeluHIS016_0210560 [Cutaneotrichosporon spelunceum]|uniref:Uncharacterized protein n=1 Tax=Cutaneotrichosporon spelunceum TaxID=1672016 RepID=A0AAD3YAG7_9TREE|nr:hypothetical protein CspeluHIS016_0210560 [Cutaneotrichosporon spelunceum]